METFVLISNNQIEYVGNDFAIASLYGRTLKAEDKDVTIQIWFDGYCRDELSL